MTSEQFLYRYLLLLPTLLWPSWLGCQRVNSTCRVSLQ